MCRLDHTFKTTPLRDSTNETTPTTKTTPTDTLQAHCEFKRSPSKKPHIQGMEVGGATSSGCGPAPLDVVAKVAAVRSFSSPAMKLTVGSDLRGEGGVACSEDKLGANSHSGTEIDIQNGKRLSPKSRSSASLESVGSETVPASADFPHFAADTIQSRPKSFDFQLSKQYSGSSASEEFLTPEGDLPDHTPQGDPPDHTNTSDSSTPSVFVFSGSGDSGVQSKTRRNATSAAAAGAGGGGGLEGVASLLQGEGPRDGDDAATMEVAMLTQQLELCSDGVSY